MKRVSYTLHETKELAVLVYDGGNAKIGEDMLQIAIVPRRMHITESRRTGHDRKHQCTGCPLAGSTWMGELFGTCYVQDRGVAMLQKSYWAGGKPMLHERDYPAVFEGRMVRFGSYGNPSKIPFRKLRKIAKLAKGYTGYFHDWHLMPESRAKAYGQFLMASVDSMSGQRHHAERLGLRWYGITAKPIEGAVACPNYTHGVQCQDCKLCGGTSVRAKSVYAFPHGSGKARLNRALGEVDA